MKKITLTLMPAASCDLLLMKFDAKLQNEMECFPVNQDTNA